MTRAKIAYNHKDRFQRDQAIKQWEQAELQLIIIEADFLDLLFSETTLSYNSIYNEYKKRYEQAALDLQNKTINCIDINFAYFKSHYFPIEGNHLN